MRYKNEQVLEALGRNIENRRKAKALEIEDVVEMTGFNYNTIKKMEAGSESSLSYFIGVCSALAVHPKEVFDIPIDISPRYPLSPTRKEKSRITKRIRFCLENNFFAEEKTAADVVKELKAQYQVQVSSSAASVILKRFEQEGQLKSFKVGGKNYYSRKD